MSAAGANAISSNTVLDALTNIGGDPRDAQAAARKYSSVDSWVNAQRTQAAVAGAAAMAIPVAHLPALVADLAFLMHKLAYCSWGIGEILKVRIDAEADFHAILAIWSGSVTDDALEVATLTGATVGAAGFGYWVVVTGQVPAIAGMAAEKAVEAILNDIGAHSVAHGTGQMMGKVAEKATAKGVAKFKAKVAPKLAAKFASKFGGKAISGMIPFVGPAVSAGVNWYFISNIAAAAHKYYAKKKQVRG